MKDDKLVENDVTFTIELGNPVVTNGDFVLASTLTEEHEEVTIGIADAIAFDPDGAPQVVIHWKSDVDLAPETLEHYRAQLRTCLDATGAERGLIVALISRNWYLGDVDRSAGANGSIP